MSSNFDAFLREKVLPEYRPIVQSFVAQVAEVAPETTLGMRGGTEAYYSVPVIRLTRDIIAISPNKTGVAFSFAKGAAFSDPDGLLTGAGKVSRIVRLSKLADYPEGAMADFIRQAVALDRS